MIKIAIVDATDFTNVASDIGESVTIYNQTETIDSDYGGLTVQTLGSGTSETAVVQREKESNIQRSDGRLVEGDLFAMFISTSVVTPNSIVEYDSKRYKVIGLDEVRVTGAIHHFEANLRLIQDGTS